MSGVGSQAVAQTFQARNISSLTHRDLVILPDRGAVYTPFTQIEFSIDPQHAFLTEIWWCLKLWIPAINGKDNDFEPSGGCGPIACLRDAILMDGAGHVIEHVVQPNIWFINRQMLTLTPGEINLLHSVGGFGNHNYSDPNGFYCEVPLSKIFGVLNTETAIPCGLMRGMKIKFMLEEGPRALRATRWAMYDVIVSSGLFDVAGDTPGTAVTVTNSKMTFHIESKMDFPLRAGDQTAYTIPLTVTNTWNTTNPQPVQDDVMVFSDSLVRDEHIQAVWSSAQINFATGGTLGKYGLMFNDTLAVGDGLATTLPFSKRWRVSVMLADHTDDDPATFVGRMEPKLANLYSNQGSLFMMRMPKSADTRQRTFQVIDPELHIRRIYIGPNEMADLAAMSVSRGLEQWYNDRLCFKAPPTQGTQRLINYEIQTYDKWVSSVYEVPVVQAVPLGSNLDWDSWYLDPLVAYQLDHYERYNIAVRSRPVPRLPIPVRVGVDMAHYYNQVARAFASDGEELRNLLWLKQGKGGCLAMATGNRGQTMNCKSAHPFQFQLEKGLDTVGGESHFCYITKRQRILYTPEGATITDGSEQDE